MSIRNASAGLVLSIVCSVICGSALAAPKVKPSDTPPKTRVEMVAGLTVLDRKIFEEFQASVEKEVVDTKAQYDSAVADIARITAFMKATDASTIDSLYQAKATCDCSPAKGCDEKIREAASVAADEASAEKVCTGLYAYWQTRKFRNLRFSNVCLTAVKRCGPIRLQREFESTSGDVGTLKKRIYNLTRQKGVIGEMIAWLSAPLKVGENTDVKSDDSAKNLLSKRTELQGLAKELDRLSPIVTAPAN